MIIIYLLLTKNNIFFPDDFYKSLNYKCIKILNDILLKFKSFEKKKNQNEKKCSLPKFGILYV